MKPRSEVRLEQFTVLIEYMERHGDLARGQLEAQDPVQSERLWSELTRLINNVGGVKKFVEKWKKIWVDWKTETKGAAPASPSPHFSLPPPLSPRVQRPRRRCPSTQLRSQKRRQRDLLSFDRVSRMFVALEKRRLAVDQASQRHHQRIQTELLDIMRQNNELLQKIAQIGQEVLDFFR